MEQESVAALVDGRDAAKDLQSPEQLEAEVSRLRETVRELSYVIYGLGHDVRAPIRTVTSYVALLKARTTVKEDPNCREYAHFIASAAQRLDALAIGVLDYARLLGSKAGPHIPVDMNIVLQTALANLQVNIDEAHAAVVHDELPKIFGDFVQLTQLIQNLISNAIKYRSPVPLQIFVKAERDGGYWLFSVEDNGIGIAPEYRNSLFVPFKRLHGDEIPGAGLGLTICRFIVERHGGRIWVDPMSERGTTFKFMLPFQKERA